MSYTRVHNLKERVWKICVFQVFLLNFGFIFVVYITGSAVGSTLYPLIKYHTEG
jgi:hypothetical protein